MKKILLALIFFASAAGASTVAFMNNRAGGVIVLTDVKCDKKSFVAYSNTSTGKTTMGCWFADDAFVFVRWADGDVSTYPFSEWTMKAKSYD